MTKIDYKTRTYRLLEALALGDSIGVTTEFFSGSGRVVSVYDKFSKYGWPFVSVGKKKWNLKPGDHTDDTDMACCLVQSVHNKVGADMFLGPDKIDPELVSKYFIDWLNTNPKDIGNTTYAVLSKLKDGVAWNDAGYEVWKTNMNGAANGSLMRNGVVCGFTDDLYLWEALDNTFIHGIITHYGALPVLTCAIQTWIIYRLFEGLNPLNESMWLDTFLTDFETWLEKTEVPEVDKWIRRVGLDHIKSAIDTLKKTEWSHYEFNPFTHPIGNSAGYCVLTLQIAIWALQWSLEKEFVFSPPKNLPHKVFDKQKEYCLGWIPMIGYDADTYGATAGPMFAAAHGSFPKEMTKNLAIHQWFKEKCSSTKKICEVSQTNAII
jgi:ADP-ribosylglycohydrolase